LEGNYAARVRLEKALSWCLGRWPDLVVISGGAVGIDTMAVTVARELGIPEERIVEHLPKGKNWPAYKARDKIIAEDCDRLICIVGECSTTHGSQWTRDEAARLGKPVKTYIIRGKGQERMWTVEIPSRSGRSLVNCGIVVRDGRVIAAAPIMEKFVGKPVSVAQEWVASKGGTCT
jgi:hypothetical protein